jgi:hypothetical protein
VKNKNPESWLSFAVGKAEHGYFIQLDELLYMDRGDMKPWAEWDRTLIPTAYINPKDIISIMQFKGDPREKLE